MMEEIIQEMDKEAIKKKIFLKKLTNTSDDFIKSENWSINDKLIKCYFPPNIPMIFGKLKGNKTPYRLRLIANKIVSPAYDLEKYMKKQYMKMIPLRFFHKLNKEFYREIKRI